MNKLILILGAIFSLNCAAENKTLEEQVEQFTQLSNLVLRATISKNAIRDNQRVVGVLEKGGGYYEIKLNDDLRRCSSVTASIENVDKKVSPPKYLIWVSPNQEACE